jgi:tRNA G18 (ribose-2'-O)-methylase SpoU
LRGFFGIGVERLSKPMNAGTLFRTAHAFGASFVFTVDAEYKVKAQRSDTSRTVDNLPWYAWPDPASLALPQGCDLVGVELVPDAVDLPSFRHPLRAAYVLGPEGDSLSPALLARCTHVVKIPTAFCINVGVAGAIVMYDRALTHGRFAERPVFSRGEPVPHAPHVHGSLLPDSLVPVARRDGRA